MADHAATGAAQRRRERRFPAWLRHELLTVAMALAEATHHSAQPRAKEGCGGRAVLRATAPEASTPGDATVGYVAAAAPLLAQPVLRGGDTLDKTAVQFLLVQTLLEPQREEEEEEEE